MVRRIGAGEESKVIAETTAQMFMQRDVMSRMFMMEPMRAISVLILYFLQMQHVHP